MNSTPPEPWTNGAIYYQIFPERFYNGNPYNDPSADKSQPIAPSHSWTSNWYALSDEESVKTNDFWRSINNRRYGGDLQGVLLKLDYLKSLGVTAIYFNPLFESKSSHKYDATLMHHIDVNFGNNPIQDLSLIESEDPMNPKTWVWTNADSLFLKVIEEAHQRGIHIIIDGVFNHVGTSFFAFQDVMKHQKNSRFSDWFEIQSFEDSTLGTRFEYKGWWGHKSLPEFKRDSLKGLASSPKQYIFEITKRWSAPNGIVSKGVDGWRLDAADDLPSAFWKEWRTYSKSLNPDIILIGEIWKNAKDWMTGDQFDAVMNYQFAIFTHQFFVQKKLKASEFQAKIEELLLSYPSLANFKLMNLYDSHDTERLMSRVINPNRHFDQESSLRNNKNFQIRPAVESEYQIQKLLMLFQFTYIGSPALYYGTEVGMWGADDPDCRKPMVWKEFQYDDEDAGVVGHANQKNKVRFNQIIFDDYQRFIAIQQHSPVLKFGSFKFIYSSDEQQVIIFERTLGAERILVAINASNKNQLIKISSITKVFDLLTKKEFTPNNGELSITLEANSGLILQ